ncbi:MAG: amylo-alpha-1,6-glucosidase, partial [Akkermansiaceae bacterium]|nr:amylo-alpha-1,6-glucosidase [Verrucomicrobiales bacterium]
RGGRVFIDIVINHTGWGAMLQENHPEWFLRHANGEFASPGAWGTVWEDLVELKHNNVVLWDQLAEMFLTWCRRGVDGFRCDAGYKVPLPAWQYIIARVQQEFPETIFLLEGLGGSWDATEALLTEGRMQWAYSELFQNYSGRDVAGYLDYALRQSERVGLYVHYSETHDNSRLAAARTAEVQPAGNASPEGRLWSLLRNRLCALTSVSGGFGFTSGVEWLATEKIRVHGSTGLAWGGKENLLPELVQLNQLLANHPCFFDAAKLTRLSAPAAAVYALLRESAEGKDACVVLVNTDAGTPQTQAFPPGANSKFQLSDLKFDLLGQELPEVKRNSSGESVVSLPPGAAYCLAPTAQPVGLSGDAYRQVRARAAWAIQVLNENLSPTEMGEYDWRALAEIVDRSPESFLAAVSQVDRELARTDLVAALQKAIEQPGFPQVIRWSLVDCRRLTPIPPAHWLLVEDEAAFRASLQPKGVVTPLHVESIRAGGRQVACFPARGFSGDAALSVERYAESQPQVKATVRFLAPEP